MDAVHEPWQFEFISPVCDLVQFRNDAVGRLNELLDVLDGGPLSKLNLDVEAPKPMEADVTDKALVLETASQRSEQMDARRRSLSLRQSTAAMWKYRRIDFDAVGADLGEEGEGAGESDVALTVVCMRPYNKQLEKSRIRLGRLLAMDSTFVVRGKTALLDLRAAIHCPADGAVQEDVSAEPNRLNCLPLAKHVYPSCFFFINNAFYASGNADLTDVVREWAARALNADMAVFEMDTAIEALRPRLGQPYLFRHQGCCDHLTVFTDVKLLAGDDARPFARYPMLISQPLQCRVTCCACKQQTATVVTRGVADVPYDVAHWCFNCFKSFNYKKGHKVGDFAAFPFTDTSTLG